MNYRIDNLQYCNWTRKIFEINREASLDAVHVTIVYHEDYDELLVEINKWEKLFKDNSDLIFLGKSFQDIENAHLIKKTAIFFGYTSAIIEALERGANVVQICSEPILEVYTPLFTNQISCKRINEFIYSYRINKKKMTKYFGLFLVVIGTKFLYEYFNL